MDCWNEALWCFHKQARQAAEHALNKDDIVNGLYTPEAINADSWSHVTPNSLGWGENLRPRAYDVAKARELLQSIGFGGADGSDGTDANGERISFTIYTWEAGDLPALPELAQLYHDFWEEGLGWDIDVVVGDAAATRQAWNNREYPGDVLVRTNEARYDGTSIAQGGFLNSAIAWRAIDDPTKEPWASSTTPVVEKGLSDLNAATRQQSYNEMYAYLYDQAYWGDGFKHQRAVGTQLRSGWLPAVEPGALRNRHLDVDAKIGAMTSKVSNLRLGGTTQRGFPLRRITTTLS